MEPFDGWGPELLPGVEEVGTALVVVGAEVGADACLDELQACNPRTLAKVKATAGFHRVTSFFPAE